MHGAIRAAGYSLMSVFVSCGVGAQDLDTRVDMIVIKSELSAQESIVRLVPTEACFDKGSTLNDITAVK